MKNPRSTPRTDAWLKQLRAELAPRGARTDLAEHIATATGTQLETWKNALARFFRGDTGPSTEVFFIIQEWLEKRRARTASKSGRRTAARV